MEPAVCAGDRVKLIMAGQPPDPVHREFFKLSSLKVKVPEENSMDDFDNGLGKDMQLEFS